MYIGNEILQDKYFMILRTNERFIEVLSKYTGHCWLVQKTMADEYKYRLYHKHKRHDEYYHLHWKNNSFRKIVQSIKSHDEYVLKISTNKNE